MDVNGKTVIVAGLGISGRSMMQVLKPRAGKVIGVDEKQPDADLHSFDQIDWDDVDLVMTSPVFNPRTPFILEAQRRGIPVMSEVELAWQLRVNADSTGEPARWIGITGTNGKTTTTALTGEIMKAYYESVFVVGNIGIPYTQVAMETEDDSVTVAEVSSFQLETIMDFRPDVSAILNITPDHLNRHHTMECYIAVKESITSNQTEEDTCVLNYDDKVLREFGQSEELKPKVIFFSSRQKLDDGYYLDGDMIYYAKNKKAEAVLDVRELNLLGRHNYENVMAAIAISRAMGVPMETIVKVAKEFKAVEHRIEFVLERSGVKYYNDSKGTNPDAAIQAIRAMPGPTLLIAGGYDKQSTYDEWIEAFDGKVKYLVLIGQTRDKIAECAKAHGFYDIMYAEDMSEAVRVCASYANMGDNVLLSPACASWGMFKNYEERGRIFKECVRSL